MIVVTVAIYGFGDVTWWGSVLLFGPRWIWATAWPLAFAAAWLTGTWQRCGASLLSGLIVLLLIVGWVIPWSAYWDELVAPTSSQTAGAHQLQVMTLNLDGQRTDLHLLQAAIAQNPIDLVALQEAPAGTEKVFPPDWHALRRGDLVIGSRWPITEKQVILRTNVPNRWPRPVGLIAVIDHPDAAFTCATLHPLTPRFGLMNLLDRRTLISLNRLDQWENETRWRWDEHRRLAAEIGASDGPVIVLGDFNAPVESRIYQTCWGQYRNAFSRAGWGSGQTIRIEVSRLTLTARIDHILTSNHWVTRRCWVGAPVGSQHLPVLAQFSRSDESLRSGTTGPLVLARSAEAP